jgi:hypothetical protein
VPQKQFVLNASGVLLGSVFMLYGTIKVLGGQFIFSHDWVINGATTDGPTLVWCFFGYSSVYGRLIGLAELVPGFLMLVPRTRLLGALIVLPVAANIAVMDFCFDFPPVKYFALLLTLGCLFLAIGERTKLQQALSIILARQAISEGAPQPGSRWRLVWVCPGLVLAFFAVHQLAAALSAGPEEAGYTACEEHGWKREEIRMVRWQTDNWSGFNSTGVVDFLTGKEREARMIRVTVWRPSAFVSWQTVGYVEMSPQTDTRELR